MKVLVVGKGGREHALVWKLAQSQRVGKLFAAPGSPGIGQLAECVEFDQADDPRELERLADWAAQEQVDLTIVGPEDVLSAGLVDRFRERDLRAFGPTAEAARIESSKSFAKALMQRTGVPTADYAVFEDSGGAIEYVREHSAPLVVKADGLAAGKGVVVAHSEETAIDAIESMMNSRSLGAAGGEVVIEEYMEGEEASLFAIADGENFVTLPTAQDHKAIFDGDKGPNTGGMGAYAPAPAMTPELIAESAETIVQPVLTEMARLGHPFSGVLYCGLMLTESGPRVVEFNARFGDPEAQVVLPLLKNDLVDLLEAAVDGRLNEVEIESHNGSAVCVVLAAAGYPESGAYAVGNRIEGLEQIEAESDLIAFHAGTRRKNGYTLTAGGRVVGITATAADIESAIRRAYEGAETVSFDEVYYRRDIGHRALNR